MKPESAAMVAPWTGPFAGVPPWDKVTPKAFPEAFTLAMDSQRKAIQRITEDPMPATFENTLVALERSGRALDRLGVLFSVHTSTLNVGEMPKLESLIMPRLAAFSDEITQNAWLFKRIEAVYNGPKTELNPEQKRLIWVYYTNFVRGGARLGAEQKVRIQAINQRLASLFTQFSQNVLDEEGNQFTVVDRLADLAGMSPDFCAGAARAAEAKGLKGKWLIANTRSSMEPLLSYAENRPLREKVWRTYVNRCDTGGKTDNKALIPEILKLRQERAQLLGYATHAHWAMEQSMAATPDRAVALMEAVWKPAAAQVRADVAEMQAIADQDKAGIKISPWDYRFYVEKLRKLKFNLDLKEVEPYMQLEKLREGMFWAAGQLYGLAFTPVTGLPLQQPEVRVWEVKDAKGQHVGLWYFDPFARAGKLSGAWMNNYRGQDKLDGVNTPIVSNNSNFMKGEAGTPVLISWDDAVTMFHEFGHALHGLQSNVTYPSLSGTAVARDFVEFPSQINEHWLQTPEVLNRFALHFQTGKPIPQDLVAKLRKSATFNQGFQTMEYLASAVIDMKFHLAAGQVTDPDAFERTELTRLGMPEEIVMRHRPTQFNHIFSSDGYSAGYYAYLWADSLTADAFEAFLEGAGPWDKAVAERLKRTVLAVGNTVDQGEAFRAFRGRDVNTDALMRKRGFPVPAKAR
jgi:peptidyl-dipeptidase Dcp